MTANPLPPNKVIVNCYCIQFFDQYNAIFVLFAQKEKMENPISFTPEEEKIRKRWLFWQVKIPMGILIIYFLASIFLTSLDINIYALSKTSIVTFLYFISFYIIYYCNYKTPGTIYLLLYIISTPIILTIASPFIMLFINTENGLLNFTTSITTIIASYIISTPITALSIIFTPIILLNNQLITFHFYNSFVDGAVVNGAESNLLNFEIRIISIIHVLRLFYLNCELKKINKKMQNNILISSEEYVHALSTFHAATNLEELDQLFTNLVRNENGTVRFRIAEAYKVRKQALE